MSIGTLPPVFSHFGGAIQRRVAELARQQARVGHRVSVFSPGIESNSTNIDGVDVHFIRCRAAQPWARIEFQLRVLTKLKDQRPAPIDILHYHSEPESGLLTRSLARKRLLSYDNFYFRGGRQSRLYKLYQFLIRDFDVLLPCSHHCLIASTEYWNLPSARLRVCYNGVNLNEMRPDPQMAHAERTALDVSSPMILYVGRLSRQKGTDTLLSAFGRIRESLPHASLVLAGPVEQFHKQDSTAAREWRARIVAAGATHLGTVSDERLVRLYNAADLFVMPTAELEMFGMAAVEALACGTPVVASDHGGLRETVPVSCGARFPPGDAAALARESLRLLTDDRRLRDCAKNARRHALQFGWDRIASHLDEIYTGRDGEFASWGPGNLS